MLEEAADAVATFVPADATGAGWQADALTAVRDAQVAVAAARGWANGAGRDEAAVVAALDDERRPPWTTSPPRSTR